MRCLINKINTIDFSILLNTLQPFFVKAPTIVSISSFSSLITNRFSCHYGTSKDAFSQILNTLIVEEPNCPVLLVNPRPTDNPFLERSAPYYLHRNINKNLMLNPDKLAKIIVKWI